MSSFQFRKRWQIIAVQSVGSTLFAIHFGMLGAAVAMGMNLVAVLRNFLFSYYSYNTRPTWPLWLVIFIVIVVSLVLWDGWVSVLPMGALILGSIALWHRDEQKIRLWTLGSPPLWIVHNIVVGSIPGAVNEVIALASIITSWVRYRKTHERHSSSKY